MRKIGAPWLHPRHSLDPARRGEVPRRPRRRGAAVAVYWFSFGLPHDFLRGEIDAAGREGVADEEVVGLVGVVVLRRP